MFSVKIDKLIDMSKNQEEDYHALTDRILNIIDLKVHSIGLVGAGTNAIKIAASLSERTGKVILVDGDFTSEAFMGKYKLGKHLLGWRDSLKNGEAVNKNVAVTSYPLMDLLFTGDEEVDWTDSMRDSFASAMDALGSEYSYVLVTSDEEGRTARCCDAAILCMSESEYTVNKAKDRVAELDRNGCYVLGVVLYE